MSEMPKISDAEWLVMQAIWDKGEATAGEIIEELEPRTGWNHRTIRTLLNRLSKKGAVACQVEGNRYLYRAGVGRSACVRRESRSFVEKVFSGDGASLLVHFARNTRLTADDVEELKRILAEKEKQIRE
jgi:BlaI family transcriptional regulator, penicillinase repressor